MNARIFFLLEILIIILVAGCKKENVPTLHLHDALVENPKYFLADTVSGVYIVSGSYDVIPGDPGAGGYGGGINNDTIIISKSHDSLIVFHSRPSLSCPTEGMPCKNTIFRSNDPSIHSLNGYTFAFYGNVPIGIDQLQEASLEVLFYSSDSIRIFSLNGVGCGGTQEYLLHGVRVH